MKAAPLFFLLAGCGVSAPPVGPPSHQAQVLSVSCDPGAGRPRADVAIRNVGSTTIEWAKGMVSFGGSMHDSYFDPRPIRPGGTASLTVYGNKGDHSACSLESVTDGDGFAATLRR